MRDIATRGEVINRLEVWHSLNICNSSGLSLLCKHTHIKICENIFVSCFIWVWNIVSHTDGRTQISGCSSTRCCGRYFGLRGRINRTLQEMSQWGKHWYALHTKYYSGYQIKYEMGGARGTYGWQKKYIQNFDTWRKETSWNDIIKKLATRRLHWPGIG
jgi:hypothetical protein